MRHIKLPCYAIVLKIDDENPGSSSISSDLQDNTKFNAAMDGIEAMILGHACAGINVESPVYIEGVETAVQACDNHF